jgi:hypothetical protein
MRDVRIPIRGIFVGLLNRLLPLLATAAVAYLTLPHADLLARDMEHRGFDPPRHERSPKPARSHLRSNQTKTLECAVVRRACSLN